jgi:hypothetical protein
LVDDFVFEIFFVSDFVLEELKGLKLLEVLEFLEFDSFLDHVLKRGHFLEGGNDIHKIVPQVYKLLLEDSPVLIEFIDFPQIFSGEDIAISLAPVVVNVHNLDFFLMQHFEHQLDLLSDLSFISAHELTLDVYPLRLCASVLLLEQLDSLVEGDVVRFCVVAHLVVVAFGNVHCDYVSVLLLLEESLLVLRLEYVPLVVVQLLVQS